MIIKEIKQLKPASKKNASSIGNLYFIIKQNTIKKRQTGYPIRDFQITAMRQ